MLTQIHIENFKGFKDTTIKPLRKVNLILGGQNVGKTSVLEAVYLGASNVASFQTIASLFRVSEGRDNLRYIDSVLGRKTRSIELSAKNGMVLRTEYNASLSAMDFFDLQALSHGNVSVERMIRGPKVVSDQDVFLRALSDEVADEISPTDALAKVPFLDPLAVSVHLPNQVGQVQLFDQAVLSRKKRVLLEMLRSIEPRLEDLHSLSPDSEQRIYVELKGEHEALPLPQLGHGFNRLVNLYCSLLVTNAKLALMDEVENGIHYSALPTLFRGIQDVAAKHGVQTIMTTHSWDCIRAAYKTFADADSLKDFQLIRLERDEDNVRAVVINDEALDTVMEAGYEVR
jgi:predicted ATP-dependent endonuclease of OLD family